MAKPKKIPGFTLRFGAVCESKGPHMLTPYDVRVACQDMAEAPQEIFAAFDLNTRNRVIERRCVSLGTLDQASIHARDVFRGAIVNNAASVLLVHNHPSGDTSPSGEDLTMTKKLIEVGLIVGIPCIDHVVVGAEDLQFVSMRERLLVDFGGTSNRLDVAVREKAPARYEDYKPRKREVWTADKCAKVSSARLKDGLGTPGPQGVFQGSADPYPQYGTQRFNGGYYDGKDYYTIGTRYPWPKVPEPYGLYRLCSWGVVICTREDAEARGLSAHELRLDIDGFEVS